MKVSVLAIAATTLVLAGCGQSSSQSGQAAAPPAPPAQATPDQVKTLLAELPAPYNTGDIVNGKSKFTQCAACHTTAEGGSNLTGPNLYGIFGRKAGSLPGYAYSDALKLPPAGPGRPADRHLDHRSARRAAGNEKCPSWA